MQVLGILFNFYELQVYKNIKYCFANGVTRVQDGNLFFVKNTSRYMYSFIYTSGEWSVKSSTATLYGYNPVTFDTFFLVPIRWIKYYDVRRFRPFFIGRSRRYLLWFASVVAKQQHVFTKRYRVDDCVSNYLGPRATGILYIIIIDCQVLTTCSPKSRQVSRNSRVLVIV